MGPHELPPGAGAWAEAGPNFGWVSTLAQKPQGVLMLWGAGFRHGAEQESSLKAHTSWAAALSTPQHTYNALCPYFSSLLSGLLFTQCSPMQFAPPVQSSLGSTAYPAHCPLLALSCMSGFQTWFQPRPRQSRWVGLLQCHLLASLSSPPSQQGRGASLLPGLLQTEGVAERGSHRAKLQRLCPHSCAQL